MAKKQNPEAANPRAQIETPSVFSANPWKLQGYTLSKSDEVYLANIAGHLADATIHDDRSRIETCAGLLSAFCMKFTQGVAHE